MKFLTFVLSSLLLLIVTNLALAGDSSGGGHARAIEFKKAAAVYVRALRYMPPTDRASFRINVSADALEDALFSRRTSVHILRETDTVIISRTRGVSVERGRITEQGSPKTAYYDQSKQTIYVAVDWDPMQTQLALKEFLRTIADVDAEQQSVHISAWYDQSSYSSSTRVAMLDISPSYEERRKTYRVEECNAAKALLRPLVTRVMYNGKTYEEMAKNSPVCDLPLFEKSKLHKPWDYGWVKDPMEQVRRAQIHRIIWDRSREALRNANVVRNVRTIIAYLSDPEMSGTATQALGEIGHPSAAEALMALVQKDIDVVGTDEHYQEFVHKNEFWAPQALGSLDYSRDATLYKKVEAKLFELMEAQRKVRFSITPTLDDGLTFLRSTSYRNLLKANLERGGVWQTARAIATIGDDYSFLVPVYVTATRADDERDFSALVKVIGKLKPAFAHRGVSQSMVFTDLVVASRTLIQNGDTLIGLIHLRPEKCE